MQPCDAFGVNYGSDVHLQLTSLITHRFRFPPDSVSLYAAKVQSRGLSAVAQCESLRYKLLNGLAVRRACYGVLRYVSHIPPLSS